MSEAQTDDFGVEIEVGDIILSSPQGSKASIGRVEKIHPSGRITIKCKHTGNIYAYERGAPDIPHQAKRDKRDENGERIRVPNPTHGARWIQYEHEEYTAYSKDYTVVGKRESWVKIQCAEISRVVLSKYDMSASLMELNDLIDMDYDAELGEIE